MRETNALERKLTASDGIKLGGEKKSHKMKEAVITIYGFWRLIGLYSKK